MSSREEAAKRARRLRDADDLAALLRWARPLSWYRPGRRVRVADRMQRISYTLEARPGRDFARGFRPALSPGRMLRMGVFEGKYLNDCVMELPREWYADALRAGKLCPEGPDPSVNHFRIKSRLSLAEWRRRGWIPATGRSATGRSATGRSAAGRSAMGRSAAGDSGVRGADPGVRGADPDVRGADPDVRGWFQWYCRYWLGRRLPGVDEVQIARWRAFTRHRAQVVAAARRLPRGRRPATRAQKRAHRPRQRQALLQWAYDPYV